VRLGDAQAATAWQAIRDVHAHLGGTPEQRVVAKLSVPIGRTLEMLAAAERLARRDGARFVGTSHAGSGIVRAGYVVDGSVDGLREGLEALRAEAERAEGSLVLEAAPAALKRAMDAWGKPRQALSVMRRLKAEFDPRGLMSPGRFVGGI
jgi:glycolate oxidase FAD binding subunit